MEEVETIYENVRILNRDEVLTEEDMEDVLGALSEREKGRCYKLYEVFR